MNYVAVIPAAGRATRLGATLTSKEIVPLSIQDAAGGHSRVAIEWLLEALVKCPLDTAYIIIRDGKWDIPKYLGAGARYGVHIAYLMMSLPFGPPYTVDQAYPFLADQSVLLGFPDVLFQPSDAFARLIMRLEGDVTADVVLGLFPTDRPQKMDMVCCDASGCVSRLKIKPIKTDLRYAWVIAAWRPSFSRFLHVYLADHRESFEQPKSPEAQIGTVIQAAIEAGMGVVGECFNNGWAIDIGTPDDLERARRMF